MTQSEAVSVVSFSAQTQQIVGQALRQIEFAADHMIDRLPIGKLKELRGGTQLLPQLSCASVGLARFRRGEAFDGLQYCA